MIKEYTITNKQIIVWYEIGTKLANELLPDYQTTRKLRSFLRKLHEPYSDFLEEANKLGQLEDNDDVRKRFADLKNEMVSVKLPVVWEAESEFVNMLDQLANDRIQRGLRPTVLTAAEEDSICKLFN